jgi:hypothetical protein
VAAGELRLFHTVGPRQDKAHLGSGRGSSVPTGQLQSPKLSSSSHSIAGRINHLNVIKIYDFAGMKLGMRSVAALSSLSYVAKFWEPLWSSGQSSWL